MSYSQVYTKRFGSGEINSGEVTLTVPAGRVWIVTDGDFWLPPGPGTGAILNGAGATFWGGVSKDTSDFSWAGYRGRCQLAAGESLIIGCFGDVQYQVTGYDFSA